MEIALGRRGQAALTDSLYFLMIAGILSVWLFYSGATYGLAIEAQGLEQYLQEYSRSSLETILYSSTPREPGISLDEATEIDYLLAAVKEDYADDASLNETKTVLLQQIKSVMQPMRPSFDYVFYIYLSDRQEFVVTLLYISEIEEADGVFKLTGKDLVLSCLPEKKSDLSNLLSSVGQVSPSSSTMRLAKLEGNEQKRLPAEIGLAMWNATYVDLSALNCEEFTG